MLQRWRPLPRSKAYTVSFSVATIASPAKARGEANTWPSSTGELQRGRGWNMSGCASSCPLRWGSCRKAVHVAGADGVAGGDAVPGAGGGMGELQAVRSSTATAAMAPDLVIPTRSYPSDVFGPRRAPGSGRTRSGRDGLLSAQPRRCAGEPSREIARVTVSLAVTDWVV